MTIPKEAKPLSKSSAKMRDFCWNKYPPDRHAIDYCFESVRKLYTCQMRAQLKNYIANDLALKILTFIVAIQVLVSARWNVDPYHEGSLVPSSVGVAQGKVIFRDVNNQYGSLVAIFNAPFHFLFGNSLIISRLVSAITFLMISYLTFLVLRLYIPRNVAHAIALSWLIMSPTWAWFSGHGSMIGVAWPNHFAVMLSLFSFLILRRLVTGSPQHVRSLAFLSGIAAFLVTQARFELYTLWVIEFLILVIFAARSLITKLTVVYWTSGSLISASIYFSYLAINHALGDWYSQTILVWFSSPPDLPAVNLNFFIFNFAGFFLLILLLFILVAINWICFRANIPAWVSIAGVVISFFAIVNIPNWLPEIRIGRSFEFKAWSQHVFDMIVFSPINLAYLLGAVILILHTSKKLLPGGLSNILNLRSNFDSIYLAGMAIGFLSLTHNFNAPYTGITIAPLLGYIFSTVNISREKFQSIWQGFALQIRRLFISFSVVSSLLFASNLFAQTADFQSPLLKGITTYDNEYQEFVDERFSAVGRFGKAGAMWMMCQTGLYTVSLDGYLGADEWSWNQQPEKWMEVRPRLASTGDSLVTCHLSPGEIHEIRALEKEGRINAVYTKDDFVIYTVIKGAES